MTPRSDLDVRNAIALEDLRGKRDARYRANLAFAGKAIRSIVLTIAVVGSLVWGWPLPAGAIMHRVPAVLGIDDGAGASVLPGHLVAAGHASGSFVAVLVDQALDAKPINERHVLELR